MRKPLRRVLRIILKFLTQKVLQKHKPKIIAIAGDGQTAVAREAVYTVLHEHLACRRNLEAPEAEFVIPLTIFGVSYYPQNYLDWLKLLARTAVQILVFKPHPNILILEMTTQRSEILDYWLEITKPNLVVTCGSVPQSRYLDKENVINVLQKDFLEPYLAVAADIGRHFGLGTLEIKRALTKFELPPSRIKILPGKGETVIVDATYQYFPPSAQAVLETIEGLEGQRHLLEKESDLSKIKVGRGDVVIVKGRRDKMQKVLEELIKNPLE